MYKKFFFVSRQQIVFKVYGWICLLRTFPSANMSLNSATMSGLLNSTLNVLREHWLWLIFNYRRQYNFKPVCWWVHREVQGWPWHVISKDGLHSWGKNNDEVMNIYQLSRKIGCLTNKMVADHIILVVALCSWTFWWHSHIKRAI